VACARARAAELDAFFGHIEQPAGLLRPVSGRAFYGARARLAATAIPARKDWRVHDADAAGFVPRWHGLRLVAADASTLRFGQAIETSAQSRTRFKAVPARRDAGISPTTSILQPFRTPHNSIR
jgi:hypothetical protein